MRIKDQLLGKYSIEIEELQIVLYVEKQRENKKTKEITTYDNIVGYYSTVQGAIKRVIREGLAENKDTFTLKQFSNEVKNRFNEMNKLFDI